MLHIMLAAPPDTSNYMVAGYVIAIFVMIVYPISLFLRFRNLKQEEALLEELKGKTK